MKVFLTGIILFIHDVPTLKSFYMRNFNMRLLEESETNDWVLLEAGPCTIGLHKIGPEYETSEAPLPNAESNTKLVFDVVEDIVEIRERLLNEGVLVKDIKTFPNYEYWLCDGEDTEGNVFQLRQKK